MVVVAVSRLPHGRSGFPDSLAQEFDAPGSQARILEWSTRLSPPLNPS